MPRCLVWTPDYFQADGVNSKKENRGIIRFPTILKEATMLHPDEARNVVGAVIRQAISDKQDKWLHGKEFDFYCNACGVDASTIRRGIKQMTQKVSHVTLKKSYR